jgi:hypothetical protein
MNRKFTTHALNVRVCTNMFVKNKDEGSRTFSSR